MQHENVYEFTVESIRDLIELGRYSEIGPAAGDACDLITKFNVALKIAEAESEGKGKVDDALRETLTEETAKESVRAFWSEILPSLFITIGTGSEAHYFRVAYNPFIAYVGDYVPLAVMLYYSERDLKTGEEHAMIPTAYVNPEAIESEGLEFEEVQGIVEGLFKETMTDFRADSPERRSNNPIITIPADQVEYYEGLITKYGWQAAEVDGFGYKIFN